MYVTPVKLKSYNKNISDICTKCIEDKGTLFHYVWQCRMIKSHLGGGKNDIRRFCHPADADINAGTTQRYLESFKSCQNIRQRQGYKKKTGNGQVKCKQHEQGKNQ